MLFLTDTITITAQNLAVKTNVLYWTTATFNASVETRLSSKWTLDVSAGYNPFTFSDNKKLKHFAIQPEARYWLCSPFSGHFVGANLLYSHYNAGGVKMPFGSFFRPWEVQVPGWPWCRRPCLWLQLDVARKAMEHRGRCRPWIWHNPLWQICMCCVRKQNWWRHKGCFHAY